MAVQAHPKTGALHSHKYHGLQANDLIRMYRLMYCSRRLDDREIQLKSCGPAMIGFSPTIAIGRSV
jgi:TPP-dependent pyruvate/acetoin dehydrogenase alpha subunit